MLTNILQLTRCAPILGYLDQIWFESVWNTNL